MKKFSELFIMYKEIIMYLIMGFATTFISWVSYSIFTSYSQRSPMTQMYYFQALFHGQLLLYLHILQIKYGFLKVTAGNLLLSLLNLANLFPLEFSPV